MAIPREADIPSRLEARSGDIDELAFFEAYFSNFIEGTEFTIDEAERIVKEGEIPPARPQDAHDVLGTYRVVADPLERARVPRTTEEFLDLLRSRHNIIMSGRPEKRPGDFKETRNQAGSYIFVEPPLVEGTLIEGFKLGQDLPTGFPRAAYQQFLISEVHPFDDGNGRVARVAMCAELSSVDQARIVVPTVYRNEYMTALRVVSREGRAEVLARTLAHAWRWTAAMPWGDRSASLGRLASTNALIDSTDAERSGVRLELP
jgi:Fic family protein